MMRKMKTLSTCNLDLMCCISEDDNDDDDRGAGMAPVAGAAQLSDGALNLKLKYCVCDYLCDVYVIFSLAVLYIHFSFKQFNVKIHIFWQYFRI